MTGDDGQNLGDLAMELKNDEYPLPEDKKQVTYTNVDVTIKFKEETKKKSVADEKRILFADSGFGVDQLLYDEDRAILRVPIVLAKEMVYHYDEYDAFRPRDELEAIASYIKGVPVTRGHPEEKIVTDRGEVLGWALDAEFEDDELRVVLEISDKSLIEDIRSGKLKGVSPGHFSRLDKSSNGEYEGTHYDVTQRDIFIDHIAIVEEGRCNVADGCGIVMDEEVIEGKNQKKKEEGDGERNMVSNTILKKLDSVLKLAEKLDDKTLKEKLDELKKALIEDVAEGERKPEGDGNVAAEAKEKKTLDVAMKQITAERDSLKTELDDIVKEERAKLIDELGTLQEVKTEDQLKEMSLDSLKSDLELVKSIRGGKFTIDEDGRTEGGSGAIRSAYKGVGVKGDKE